MKHRIGIIGYGGMGSYHHELLQKVKEAESASVYDINPERAALAKKNGLTVCDTFEEFITSGIDLAIVATPNPVHADYSKRCLRAGLNVISEKPVCMNAAELEGVLAVAEETGKLFTVHQNRRWDRDYRTMLEVIASGSIGSPFYIENRVQGSRGIPNDWRVIPEQGGGMLYDWAVHLLDQMLDMVASPVTEVCAHLLRVKYKDVDDNLKVLLRFENGVSGLVEVDTFCFAPLPRWHVTGDGGTAVIDNWDCQGRVISPNDKKINWMDIVVFTSAGPTRTMAPRPVETTEETPLPCVTTDVCDFYRNVLASIERKAELIVKPEQALRVMKIIDAAFASQREGCGQKVHI